MAQNIGVGTNSPTEKLEVSGIVYTNTGGIKFPDKTIQTTAAFNSTPEDAAVPKGLAFMTVTGITGPNDTLGITGAFMLYDLDVGGVVNLSRGHQISRKIRSKC